MVSSQSDKVNFIRRYARTDRPLSQFDADISRYRDQMNDIRSNDDEAPAINFIRVDCSFLKVRTRCTTSASCCILPQ